MRQQVEVKKASAPMATPRSKRSAAAPAAATATIAAAAPRQSSMSLSGRQTSIGAAVGDQVIVEQQAPGPF